MTIKLNPNPTFKTAVKLTVPGQADSAVVEFTWRHKTRSALEAWMKKPAAEKLKGVTISDTQYLGEVIEGWSGPVDENDSPVLYTADTLQKLLEAYPTAGQELFNAYVNQLTESRAKN